MEEQDEARERESLRARLAARWPRVWEATADNGHAALLVAGRGVISQYGYLEFIGGYVPMIREAYALIVPGREPVLILPTASDAAEARRRVGLEARVAGGGPLVADSPDLGQVVAEILATNGQAGDTVGVVGLASIVTAGAAAGLRRALGSDRIVDATALMDDLKSIKTVDDLVEMRATARIADYGFEVLQEQIRVGATPWELAGDVHGAIRARGARDALVFVSAGANTTVAVQGRPLRPGDLVSALVELAGPTGYWVEYSGLFAIGELDEEHSELADACLNAAAAAADLLAPGTPVAEVATAIDRHAHAVGARTGIWHGHGVGVDHDIPMIGSADTRHLQAGMTIAVHPNFSERRERFGAMVADTYAIEESGARRLSTIDQQLHRVST